MHDRKLDRGNPSPGNIGSDFRRLGILIWPDARALDRRTSVRQALLEDLNLWRNAIAHQDFDASRLGGRTAVELAQIHRWRSACRGLALSFDAVVRARVIALTGFAPW